MSKLVKELSLGRHRIAVDRYESAAVLQSRIQSGLVLIKFTDTLGGTELGVRLEQNGASDDTADFSQSVGKVRLVGRLTLDFVPVRCHAEIDLSSLTGEGYFVPLDDVADSSETAH